MVHRYCSKWRLKANVNKIAVMVFSKWKWGKHKLPKMLSYSYLGISNGAWDVHLKKVLDTGRKKVNQLHSNNNSPTSDILLLD